MLSLSAVSSNEVGKSGTECALFFVDWHLKRFVRTKNKALEQRLTNMVWTEALGQFHLLEIFPSQERSCISSLFS